MAMLSNPMFAASEGGKLERIGRQKAMISHDAGTKKGSIKIAVAKRFLVSIEGEGVSAEELKAYARVINYKKLAALP